MAGPATPGTIDVWDEVYFASGRAAGRLQMRDPDTDVLVAILSGTADAARGAYDVHAEYFGQFGDLTFKRAVPFVEVFAMAMVSRWVRQACKSDDRLDSTEVWARLARYVLTVFSNLSDERWEESWWIHVQFNHGEDLRESGNSDAIMQQTTEHVLLLSLAARALGEPLSWRPVSPPIPADDPYQLSKGGLEPPPGLPWTDFRLVLELDHHLVVSEAGMYAAFKAIQQDRGGP